MKKLILMIIAVAASFTASYAGSEHTIHSLITEQIKVPAQLKKQKLNETVNVQFTIGENGKASVINVETSNTDLKKYITEKFQVIDFSKTTKSQGVTYFVVINFKVL